MNTRRFASFYVDLTDSPCVREILLTLGHSQTVEAFLKAAARKRKITVVVAETAPSYLGRNLALALSTSGIPTLLVPDSAIFSLMSRISKVILGTHAVRADGSLLAITGSLPVCRAAAAQRVPVVVLTGMFKVSPDFSFSANEVDEWDAGAPHELLRVRAGDTDDAEEEQDPITQEELQSVKVDVEVLSPYYDRVPQELVSLFITNM